MRSIRRLREAAESVPVAAESITGAADRLKSGVDVATLAILAALALSVVALCVALNRE